MAFQSRPEPMNASPHHSKVKVTLTLSDPVYVSGGNISGKMEVESRADLDSLLGIGVMMVELCAIQEVHSGERSATSTFIHSRRLFQGPGLPPSNAVYSDYVPGPDEIPLPAHHFAARRGQTTFFFQFPLPASSPSSIDFGPASIKYEMRASVSVALGEDKRLVTDKREIKVVECWDPSNATSPQAALTTEGGKIFAHATLTNGIVVGGEPACIELQLKNHTQRWTSGITVTLMRDLCLSQSSLAGSSSLNVSDVSTQVEFRGPEYSVPPGVEGIATLVVDIPRHSRGVKGGPRVDDNGRTTECFFEVRCAFKIKIDMPPGSEDTVLTLPLIIYHSLAIPEVSVPSPRLPPSRSYTPSISPKLLVHSPTAGLIPDYTGNRIQEYDPTWTSVWPTSNCLADQHIERTTHNWQDNFYSYTPPFQRPISAAPYSQAPYYMPGLSTSHASSPRLLPPPPSHMPYTSCVRPGAPADTIDGYTDPDLGAVVGSPTSQNILLAAHYPSISPSSQCYPASQARQPPSPSRARPLPIQIPPLPNPHDSQGILHSPRPHPSPKHSFHGSIPRTDNVFALEHMADEGAKPTKNLSLDLSENDAGADGRAPHGRMADWQPDLGVEKTLPAPPAPSSKDRQPLVQRPHVDTLFISEETMPSHSNSPSSTDHIPPTPPIAAITPIKFLKAPTELSGLGANLGKDVSPESGLDALERRLLAEVGTHKINADERRHVRSIVQPITIPPSGPPPDAANDSAISSLTLADREGLLKAPAEREQEQDRDWDERTQHNGGGGHSPSEDERDARTQKGKNSRKLGKSKHSEEDLERAGRRRERKKVKDEEGRKLRKEAKGRVAAWLGEIDISVAPVMDDSSSFISPTTSHFVPITESASFGPAPEDMDKVEERPGCENATDRDVLASPNPRSSGFVTISTLNTAVATRGSSGEVSSFMPSPRRSSLNDFRQTPSSSPNRPPLSRSPSAEVNRSEPTPARTQLPQSPPQPTRLFPGRVPRFPPKPMDPEVKYDVRSARGGRGGKVTQVASLWAAKANAKTGDKTPVPGSAPKKAKPIQATPPAVRKPALNAFKRGPIPVRSPPPRLGAPTGLNRFAVRGERPGVGVGMGPGLGTREMTKPAKATTVPAVLSSSHAVPMLSSTASLARAKALGSGAGVGQGRSLPPMISETISDLRTSKHTGGAVKTGVGAGGGALGELAFGQARLRDLIKKYQG